VVLWRLKDERWGGGLIPCLARHMTLREPIQKNREGCCSFPSLFNREESTAESGTVGGERMKTNLIPFAMTERKIPLGTGSHQHCR